MTITLYMLAVTCRNCVDPDVETTFSSSHFLQRQTITTSPMKSFIYIYNHIMDMALVFGDLDPFSNCRGHIFL